MHPVGDIPLDQAALIEPLAVGYHAFERSGGASGDVAFVGGAGPIGLLTAAVLKAHGLTVVMSELSEARKQKALASGVADVVLDPSKDDVAAEVLRLTDGVGVDVAFECSSVQAVLDLLLDVVRPGGVIVNVSIWAHPAVIDIQKLVLKEIDLRGTIAYVRDHPRVIELVRSGKIDVTPFITARLGLDDLLSGFDTLVHHNDTTVKVLVHP